jgi:hypothetical protein
VLPVSCVSWQRAAGAIPLSCAASFVQLAPSPRSLVFYQLAEH